VSAVITTYAGLLRALERLPPPAAGQVRVFRGQTGDYETMTPTGLRGPRDKDMIWPIYSSRLAEDMAGSGDEAAEVGDDLSRIMLWVQAIKQHYGPGTEFLDVTHSPAIAAWFALHKMERVPVQAAYGPPGPFDPRTDVVGQHELLRHVPFDEPGYLYAFDVVEATGIEDLGHGRMFDLARAPRAYASSARIRTQEACLIHADAEVDGGDLKSFIVPGTPLTVGWPLDGCPEVNGSTNQVFPPARDDDWYARFVAVPLAPDLRRSVDQTVFDHPIKVSLYMPAGSGEAQDRELLDDLTYRLVTQRPPLLYASELASDDERTDHPLWQRFGEATALLLEGPLMTVVAPVENMNLGLLPTGLSDAAPVRDPGAAAAAGSVSLTNVFIELSVLDAAGWERLEHEDPEEELLRGIWLVRDGERFFLTIFVGMAGGGRYTAGPVEIAYDADMAAFMMPGDDSGTRRPLLELEPLARPFFKALALVRMLSPRWKLSSSAQASMGGEDGRIVSWVGLEWALGELLTLRRVNGPLNAYCVLRQWGSDEPFYGDVGLDSPARAEAVRLEGQPFTEMDPAWLLSMVGPAIADRDAQPPPV
jgi:hypothetical protein